VVSDDLLGQRVKKVWIILHWSVLDFFGRLLAFSIVIIVSLRGLMEVSCLDLFFFVMFIVRLGVGESVGCVSQHLYLLLGGWMLFSMF
jgi:hypothetical protein